MNEKDRTMTEENRDLQAEIDELSAMIAEVWAYPASQQKTDTLCKLYADLVDLEDRLSQTCHVPPPPDRARELCIMFQNRDDAFWGIETMKCGRLFTGSPYSGIQCTGFAYRIRQYLGAPARIYRVAAEPPALIAEIADGHDFAVVHGRYVVDPWIGEVELGRIEIPAAGVHFPFGKIVFDLEQPDDAVAIRALYGSLCWAHMEGIEVIADDADWKRFS